MHIIITKEHIDKSVQLLKTDPSLRCSVCPIAIALQEQLPNRTVRVYDKEASVNGAYINLPKEARRFIQEFDAWYDDILYYSKTGTPPVTPVTFDLPIPEDFQ